MRRNNFEIWEQRFNLKVAYSFPPGLICGKKKRYPVLCFLHGNGECERESDPRMVTNNRGKDINAAMSLHGPLAGAEFKPQFRFFKPSATLAAKEFIIVCPQLKNPGGDCWLDQKKTVMDIVKDMHLSENGDPNRTFLTGFSYGGNGVLRIAQEPDGVQWTAFWVVDPEMEPIAKPRQPTFLCMGPLAAPFINKYMELGFREVQEPYCGKYVYHQYTMPKELPQDKYHSYTSWASYADKAIYEWLLSQKKGTHDERDAGTRSCRHLLEP